MSHLQQLGIVRWVTKHRHTAANTDVVIVIDDHDHQTKLLLINMLRAINLTLDDVSIIDTKQIENSKPRLMLALGELAAQTLLNTKSSLESLRGKLHAYGEQQTPLIVTYHPAHLLRNPADKKKAFIDLMMTKLHL